MPTLARHATNLIVVVVLLLSIGHVAPARAQEDPDRFIARIVSQMTPEAKVGQLFVVSFPGTNVNMTSDIGELITTFRVGGVTISATNGNITNTVNAPTQVAGLTAALQNLARSIANVPGPGGRTTPFIPLFIAIEQSGNGQPYTQLTSGASPLPSPMALGATWKTEDAAAVGTLVGTELSALGINLIIGPSLNVLDEPRPASAGGGSRVFGGDPYWAGVMGQDYVRGLRAGSQGRLAAVLTHFPGQAGAGDDGDIVDRSLEQLKKVELVPFLYVLQPASGEQRSPADALMTSNVRYRGFTGNIRERTAPIAVDTQAMQSLLALPEVKAWREAGGVLFSDSLGSPLVRRYYDPAGVTFPGQKAALDALQAGNDVLMLTDYGVTNLWVEQLANIKSTIRAFQDKYSTDLTFQKRVDDAVTRILRLKFRLYPNFDPAAVIANPANVAAVVGRSRAISLQVAQDALTLISPSAAAVAEKPLPVPTPPDTFLILTEDRPYKECPTCPTQPLLATDALAQTIARLYPTRDPTRVTSASFSSLLSFLNSTAPASAPDLGAAFAAATWIVFATLDSDPAFPQSNALRQLVAQRPGLLANKRVVIFAFDAPNSLEAEIITKVTAVYALYSRTEPFLEVAVRTLFGELKPRGNSPVSVEAIRYRLITQTEPKPDQLILLFVGDPPTSGQATPVPPSVKAGDTLKVRTGPIVDRNGHTVPDGTQVTFSRTFSQNVELPPLVAPTRGGVATVSFVLDRDRIGPLVVRASSEPAMTSVRLQLTISEQPSPIISISPPTPTAPPTATFTVTPAPTETATPTPTPTPPPEAPGPLEPPRWVKWYDLPIAVLGAVIVGSAAFWTQRTRRRRQADSDVIAESLRWALWSVLAGLIGYVLYGAGLGSAVARSAFGALAALMVVLIYGAVPVIIGFRMSDPRLRGGNRK